MGWVNFPQPTPTGKEYSCNNDDNYAPLKFVYLSKHFEWFMNQISREGRAGAGPRFLILSEALAGFLKRPVGRGWSEG